MAKIVIRPYGSAPGFSSEPFPIIQPLLVARSVFKRAADPQTQGHRRSTHPMVYALPLEGIIAHGEEGNSLEEFQNPNAKMRVSFTEATSRNNFQDLPFDIKPSSDRNENGDPKAYLLKIKLPGSTLSDWRKVNDEAVTLHIARQETYADGVKSEAVVLHVRIDTNKVSADPGFTEFTAKPARKDGAFVATFALPDYIDYERLLQDNESPVQYPQGLSALDRRAGHLNIILPVTDDVAPRKAILPGLGGGPGGQ